MTLEGWLFNLCDSESPDKSIIAYNFGLFETEDGYSIYLTGSNEFDEDDSEWATNSDFEPKDKYFKLPGNDYKSLRIGASCIDKNNNLTQFVLHSRMRWPRSSSRNWQLDRLNDRTIIVGIRKRKDQSFLHYYCPPR